MDDTMAYPLITCFLYGAVKNREGNPIPDLTAVGVDADKDKPGVRELKEWVGLMEFVRSFPGTDSNGLPEIPASDRARQGRMAAKVSYSPVYLLSRGTFVTWGAFNALLLLITLLALLVVVILVKLQPRRCPAKT